jgi:hypothetical protein
MLGSGSGTAGVQEMLSMRGREQMDAQFAPQDVSTVRLEFTSLTPTLISRAAPSARLISTSPRMIGQAPISAALGR